MKNNLMKLKSEYDIKEIKNIKIIKNILKTLSFVLMFTLICSSSFSKVYAERYKYSFKISDSEKYEVIYDVNGGTYNKVSSAYNSINSLTGDGITTGDSLYSIIVKDYENGYNTSNKASKFADKIVKRGEVLQELLELFVTSQTDNSGNKIFVELTFNEDILLMGYSDGSIKWNTVKINNSEKSYKDIIVTEAASNTRTQSPFKVNNSVRNSDDIKYDTNILNEYYSDDLLVKYYDLLDDTGRNKYNWITKEITDESIIAEDGYRITIDQVSSPSFTLAKILDNENNLLAQFILAEKNDQGKYVESVYSNNVKPYVKVTSNGIELIAEGTHDESILLYQSYLNASKSKISKYLYDGHISIPRSGAYVAIRNAASDSIDFYLIEKEGTDNGTTQKSTLIGSRNININADGTTNEMSANLGDWILKKTDGSYIIYKDGEIDIDNNAFYVDYENAFISFNDDDKTYDICFPTHKGITKSSQNYYGIGSYYAFIHTNKSLGKKTAYDNYYSVFDIFDDDLSDPSVEMTLEIYRQDKVLNKSGTSIDNDCMSLSQFTSSSEDTTLPPKLSIKNIIANSDSRNSIYEKIQSNSFDVISRGYYGNVLVDTTEVSYDFIATILGYGKIILIFVIFLAIVLAGARHILEGSQDAKARAKTIETMKSIAIGTIVFLVVSFIVALMANFIREGFDYLDNTEISEYEQYFDDEDDYGVDEGILAIVRILLNVYNEIMAGMYQILTKQLIGENTESYIQVIYDVYDDYGEVSSMAPFDDDGVEWTRILSGYNCLVSISFFLMLLAIVKTAIEYVIFATDEKKITQIKETWFRIFWAIILILLLPYMVNGLIYLFNYLVAVVPVNYSEARYDLVIDYDGLLGTIADNIFITTKFNIVYAFMVRHVMLDMLLVSGPIVLALWAISDKFKSWKLWFGELITNIAMQFCYAVGFMVILFLSYDGQSPLYGFLLVSVSMAMSKFVKDSLQGFFAAGAGINEEAEGSNITKKVFGWGGKFKNGIKTTGRLITKTANKIDPDSNTKLARFSKNFGNVLSGNFSKMQFRTGEEDALRKMNSAYKKAGEGTELYDEMQKYEDAYKKYKNGENHSFVVDDDEKFKAINDYYKNVRKNENNGKLEYDDKGLIGGINKVKEKNREMLAKHYLNKYGESLDDSKNAKTSNEESKEDQEDKEDKKDQEENSNKTQDEETSDNDASTSNDTSNYGDEDYSSNDEDDGYDDADDDVDDDVDDDANGRFDSYTDFLSEHSNELIQDAQIQGEEAMARNAAEVGEYQAEFDENALMTAAFVARDSNQLAYLIASKEMQEQQAIAVTESNMAQAQAIKDCVKEQTIEQWIQYLAESDAKYTNSANKYMIDALTQELASRNKAKLENAGIDIDEEALNQLLGGSANKTFGDINVALKQNNKK